MAKARNGEGSIFKITKPNGKVKYVVEMTLGYGPNGKRKRTRREFSTRKEANEARIRLASENLDGRLTIINAETVRKYGLQWVREVKVREVRDNTASDYEARLRREVFPSLGNVRMTDLTAMHVERWIASLVRKGLSASTINGARVVLSGMCNHAELTGVINKNPVRLTRTVKRKMGDRTQVCEPWNRDEVWKALNAVSAEMGEGVLDVFLHLMLHSGVRPGEALGLRWIDIDFDKQIFKVTGTLKESRLIMPNGQGVVRLVRNEPKTASSRRPLPIDDALNAALTRQQMLQEIQRITAGDQWEETGYVVTTSVGTPWSANNLRKVYRDFLDRVGVRYIRFHDLRHTVARLALDEGNVPIEQASQALGHTRIDTTKQIYAGYVPRYNDEFSKGLSKVLPPCPEPFRPNPESPIEQGVDQ
jgi:integrase